MKKIMLELTSDNDIKPENLSIACVDEAGNRLKCRIIEPAVQAQGEPVGEIRVYNGSICSTRLNQPIVDGAYDVYLQREHPITDGSGREWQSIETAPKDGTQLLLWGCYWSDSQGWMPEAMAVQWANTRWVCYGKVEFGARPTHWMHLPAPPQSDAQES